MRPWFSETLSLSPSTETNALNAIAIFKDARGLTIFAEADPAYDQRPKRRSRRRVAKSEDQKGESKQPSPRKEVSGRSSGRNWRRGRNTSLVGELGEAAFLHKALAKGLCVGRPWGDSRRYDFVVQAKSTSNVFHRIQVKCTECMNLGAYQVPIHYSLGRNHKARYTSDDIDFLVGYIIPLNVFYVIPVAAFPDVSTLRLYPQGGKYDVAKFEEYREAWHLLSE